MAAPFIFGNEYVIGNNIQLLLRFALNIFTTGTAKYAQYATNAYSFVTNMWYPVSNCFYTGTANDGLTKATAVVPVDTQVWTHLALRNLTGAYTNCFTFAENSHMITSNLAGVTNWGYDFDRDKDGKKLTFDYMLANPPFGVEWKQQLRYIEQ